MMHTRILLLLTTGLMSTATLAVTPTKPLPTLAPAASLPAPRSLPRSLPAPRAMTAGSRDIGWSCLLEPSSRVDLASEIPGVLDAVQVERGASVRRGTVLARLRSGVEEASVGLARAKSDFGVRKSTRNEELFVDQMISTHEKDELETESQIAKMELREAEERLRMRQILSPIDGIVIERHKSPGEYVGSEPIFTLVRVDPLHVEVVVPASRYGTIRKGMTADVKPEQPVGGSYKAKVTIVDPVIDAASGTFGVRLTLPNPGYNLPAGLKCAISFEP